MSEEKKLRTFEVTIPIAGHAFISVEAENEEDAISLGMDMVTLDNVEEWETVERFTQGNVCYCPRPWQAQATDVSRDDEDEG